MNNDVVKMMNNVMDNDKINEIYDEMINASKPCVV